MLNFKKFLLAGAILPVLVATVVDASAQQPRMCGNQPCPPQQQQRLQQPKPQATAPNPQQMQRQQALQKQQQQQQLLQQQRQQAAQQKQQQMQMQRQQALQKQQQNQQAIQQKQQQQQLLQQQRQQAAQQKQQQLQQQRQQALQKQQQQQQLLQQQRQQAIQQKQQQQQLLQQQRQQAIQQKQQQQLLQQQQRQQAIQQKQQQQLLQQQQRQQAIQQKQQQQLLQQQQRQQAIQQKQQQQLLQQQQRQQAIQQQRLQQQQGLIGRPVRQGGGIGPAGAAAIGVGVGVVGGYMLSNQFRGGVTEVRTHRQTWEQDGVTYVNEPGRVIVRDPAGYRYIRHNETERFAVLGYQTRQERDGAFYRTIYDRPDGVRIITVTDADGHLIRRIRRHRDGREVVIIDNGFRPRPVRFAEQVVVLPPPQLTIPRERYIVDAGISDEATIYETLTAPPVSKPARRYTLDEVRYSPDLRAQMRSVDVNTITFESGSWEVPPAEASHLATIAAAINKAIEKNAEEVFLVEGHTDAVGDADDNLSLSDRRAESVAEILTRDFNIPAENLTTQGYGETQLRVPTDGAARANRRVTLRRITPLIASGDQPQ